MRMTYTLCTQHAMQLVLQVHDPVIIEMSGPATSSMTNNRAFLDPDNALNSVTVTELASVTVGAYVILTKLL